MTDDLVSLPADRMRRVAGSLLLLAGLVLAGCTPPPGPAGPRLPVYAADVTGGAKVCEVPAINPAAEKVTETSISVVNDGGWCGILLHQQGPKPFEAGLLTNRPSHGTILIHEVGDDTRIDYTPDRGFAGRDAFAVKLIPGSAVLQVGVTVTTPKG